MSKFNRHLIDMNEQVVDSSVTNGNIRKIEVNFTIKLKNEQVVSSRVMNRNIRKIQINQVKNVKNVKKISRGNEFRSINEDYY